ncbi:MULTISPECIES: S8 family serine peptidase [unclassified Microcoleus]|uniref:S8 family serine peptidase n=1 Tax=unclassified Microcoleus TaxID=2642155 RepID=UPI002FD08372
MESTLGILASDREQQLTAALTTFGNSGQLNFFTASNQFNGSIPTHGFNTANLKASAIGEQGQIADFVVAQSSDILSYSGSDRAANTTSSAPQTSNLGASPDTDPLTGIRTASQVYLTLPNNSLASALDVVGVENGRVTLNDFVGANDIEDSYRFTINSTSDLNLRLDGLTVDADLELIKDNNSNRLVDVGEIVDQSINFGSTPDNINLLGVSPGTYYVRVSSFLGASTNYSLTLSATPSTSFNRNYGYGLVNANAAVSRAQNRPTLFPEVPNLGEVDWGRNMINAPEVWNQGITGNGIVVAVIDRGVDYTHSDLDANIWQNIDEIPNNRIDDDRNGFIDDVIGWDFVSNDNTPMDEMTRGYYADSSYGHGTHIAGAIAAERNDFGITGVAYNAKIMPLRVLPAQGESFGNNITAAIRYAADNGANVINISLGYSSYHMEIDNAIQYATNKGAVVVMAAGNNGSSQPRYPARDADRGGIAVGALARNSVMPSFSNRAGFRPLDYVIAPGVGIYSTTPDNTYKAEDGTSMATPHVAGVAALVLNANPTLTPAQVEYILTTTANSNGIIA